MPTLSVPTKRLLGGPLPRPGRMRARGVAWLLAALILAGTMVRSPGGAAPALAELPLFASTQDSLPAATATKDYFVRLPEHVAFRAGSELRFVLHRPAGLTNRLCALMVGLNGQTLVQTNVNGSLGGAVEEDPILLRLAIPEATLVAGWNKVSLRFVWRTEPGAASVPGDQFSWVLRRAESFLSLSFERLPLFAELSRFPHTVAEEKLLRPDTDSPFTDDGIVPAVAILVPGRSRDVHLRTTAIVAARFGQLGYLDERHCRIEAIEFWKTEAGQRDAILIGRRDQLGGIELPANVTAALASLKAGQGLLAEFIHGPAGNAHRLVLITGADDAGLEKAALTIGSSPALTDAPLSPTIIDATPEISDALESEARPGPGSVRLTRGMPIQLRGLFRSEQSVSHWRLPPWFQLGPGSSLRLRFTHSPALLPGGSSLEALINGASVGTVALGPATAAAGAANLPLPDGLPGRDPMMLTFRATLAVAEADCAPRTNEQAWLDISGDSTFESTTEPIPIGGLSQLHRFLLADCFARRAAYVVPAGPSIDQIRTLFSLWFDLGRSLPSSPILWPEVVTYQPGRPLHSIRLGDRSVLFLGPVSHWSAVLPGGTQRPAVLMASPDSDVASMQGRDVKIAAFDPTLAFAQMLPSPWSDKDTLVIAGGWRDYAIPAMPRLLRDSASRDRLQGNLAAIDALGRVAPYDLRAAGMESFAERVLHTIPPGLTAEESQHHVSAQEAQSTTAQRWNRITFYLCGSLLFMLVLGRLGFMWEQVRVRQKSLVEEKAAGGAS